MEGTAAPFLSLVTIAIFLLSCFSSKGRIALLLCYVVQHVLYPFFFTALYFVIIKNDAKPSSLSLPSSPPTSPGVPLWLCAQMHTHILWSSLAFPWLHSLSPKPSWHAARPRAVQPGCGWILERNRASPYVLLFTGTFHGYLTKTVRLILVSHAQLVVGNTWKVPLKSTFYRLPPHSMPRLFQFYCRCQLTSGDISGFVFSVTPDPKFVLGIRSISGPADQVP